VHARVLGCRAPRLGTATPSKIPPLLWVLPGREAALENSCGGSGACFEQGFGLGGPWRSLPRPATPCGVGRLGVQTLGGRGAGLATLPDLLLAWPGVSGRSLPSCGAGGCRVKQSPPSKALRGGGPGSCVPGDAWRAESARHPVPSAALLLCTVHLCHQSYPGRKFCRREIIVFNLFYPQTMARSPSCRQEGTSSPSPSSSPSK